MVSAFINKYVIFLLTFSAPGDYKPPPEKDQLTTMIIKLFVIKLYQGLQIRRLLCDRDFLL